MIKSKLAIGLVVSAAAFPAAAYAGYDETGAVGLRSPDARDAALAAAASTSSDFRSPDARDAAIAAQRGGSTRIVVASASAPAADDGFDWGDAGIGATAILGVVAIGGGAVMIVTAQRRRRVHPPASPAGTV